MLAGAGVYPLPGHERLRSGIEAMENGGRKEDFYIDLSTDQVLTKKAGVAAFPVPAMSVAGSESLSASVYKIRNSDRDVVGLAAQVTGNVPDSLGEPVPAVNWILMVPSRGTLVLDQERVLPGSLIPEMASVQQGTVVSGDGEFAGLNGRYVQAEITETDYDSGNESRYILLSTRVWSEAE